MTDQRYGARGNHPGWTADELMQMSRTSSRVIEAFAIPDLLAKIEELTRENAVLKHYDDPGKKILSHKWLDSNCIENGCQSLKLATLERLGNDLRDELKLHDYGGRIHPTIAAWDAAVPPKPSES